ncbi:ABC-type uncharacterized transport system, substrate-binding protein [Oribacterium sp. WCC10]|nr:ABC-type uncharacterized transport system, substrate-binding protein [Oribacterium sp. WCC10]
MKLIHFKVFLSEIASFGGQIKKTAGRIVCIILSLMLTFSFTGCRSRDVVEVNLEKQDHDFLLTPCKKENGEAFTIAFMDLGPPIESSYLCLKGLAEGLQDSGYIDADVPLSLAPQDFFEYYDVLVNSDLGGYIKFCEEPYMIDEGDNKDIAKELIEKTNNGTIDVIVATGTDPGLFLKGLDLPVPFLVCLATDPVASGIIDSADDTGDPDIWALVEPNPYKRQFEGYYRMLEFDKILLVTVNGMDTITGNPLYREAADELGVNILELNFEESDMHANDYEDKIANGIRDANLTGIDAALFAYGTMDDDNADMLSSMLARRGIPSLVGDGDSICENGAMMCLSCFDYEGYGNYASMVLSNIFHGRKAGEQPCRYTSSPHVVLNMNTAEQTGFKCTFGFLQGVDRIYR